MSGMGQGAGRDVADSRQPVAAGHEGRTKSPEILRGAVGTEPAGCGAPVGRLRAGEAVIDLQRQMLLDARGRPVPLRARAWLVLSLLAERAGHLVGKETLMSAVWTDCIVTDDALVQAVADIRRALGPTARACLRTVPRRGYLLLADAEPPLSPAACAEGAPGDGVRDGVDRELAAQADRLFVGREAELSRLADIARAAGPTRVALLHGPGGIGKSMLLDRLKRRIAGLGVRTVELDADLLDPCADSLLAALSAAIGRPAAASVEALAAVWPASPTLLAIDSAERLAGLQSLLRDRLLPALPAGTRTVIAGRDPPDVRWHAHPRWGPAVETIGLGELGLQDALALLERLGVDAALRARACALAQGHPLTLALLGAQAARSATLPDELGADVLGVLMQRCVAQAPDAAHRHALQVAALAERTTETLLAATVPDGSAAELYDWMARQDYMRRQAAGLAMHELVRDAVICDLQARDPAAARRLQLAVFAHLTERLRSAPAYGPVTVGVTRLLRAVPVVRRLFFDGLERYLVDAAGPADAAVIRAFAQRGLPAFELQPVGHWIGHPAARWQLIREDGRRLCGVSCILRLDRLEPADLEADPLVARVLRALGGSAPGGAMMARFTVPEGERGPSNPSMVALQCNQARLWAATPGIGQWVIASVHPERYGELFGRMRFERMPDCEVSADGVAIGCYRHDFLTEPWERWFERVTDPGATGAPGG
jgi:DNA-binding winged helix-turn-helix (wHTH) protein